MSLRIGHGYDIHRTVAGRPLVLGGVKFDAPFGLDGHSDADALTHAICDALLGAAGLPDIGHQFPNTDPAFKNADSQVLLQRVVAVLRHHGFVSPPAKQLIEQESQDEIVLGNQELQGWSPERAPTPLAGDDERSWRENGRGGGALREKPRYRSAAADRCILAS